MFTVCLPSHTQTHTRHARARQFDNQIEYAEMKYYGVGTVNSVNEVVMSEYWLEISFVLWFRMQSLWYGGRGGSFQRSDVGAFSREFWLAGRVPFRINFNRFFEIAIDRQYNIVLDTLWAIDLAVTNTNCSIYWSFGYSLQSELPHYSVFGLSVNCCLKNFDLEKLRKRKQ